MDPQYINVKLVNGDEIIGLSDFFDTEDKGVIEIHMPMKVSVSPVGISYALYNPYTKHESVMLSPNHVLFIDVADTNGVNLYEEFISILTGKDSDHIIH